MNKKIIKLINYKQTFAREIEKLKKKYYKKEDEKTTLAKAIQNVNR